MERDHNDHSSCWCKPFVYEACSECRAFADIADEENRASAVISAIAVEVSLVGVQAERPKKSKGCWKCGGLGVVQLDDESAGRTPLPEEPERYVFHRKQAVAAAAEVPA